MTGELSLNLLLPVSPSLGQCETIITLAQKNDVQFHHLGDLADGGVSAENLVRELQGGVPIFARRMERDPAGRRRGYNLSLTLIREAMPTRQRGAVVSGVLCLSFPNSVLTEQDETSLYLGPAWRTALIKLLDPIVRVLDPPIGCSAPIFSDNEDDDECCDEYGWLRPESREQLIPRLTELTYLGKAATDRFGRDLLESLPGAKVTPFPLGGVFIDLLSVPPSAADEEIEDIAIIPSRHLGLPRSIAI